MELYNQAYMPQQDATLDLTGLDEDQYSQALMELDEVKPEELVEKKDVQPQ